MIPGVRHTELVILAAIALMVPALPGLFDGALSPTAALVRFAVALVLCWAAGAVLEGLLDTYGRQARQRQLEERLRQLRAAHDLTLEPQPTERRTPHPGN